MGKLNELRNKKIKGMILLEAVVALAVFASIASLVLGQINQSRASEMILLQKGEALRLAKMALQTESSQLEMNGVQVSLSQTEDQLLVYQGEEKIVAVQVQ